MAFHNASNCNSVKCLQHHRGLDCGDLHGVAGEGTLIATVSITKAASKTNTRVTTEPHKYESNEIAEMKNLSSIRNKSSRQKQRQDGKAWPRRAGVWMTKTSNQFKVARSL